MERTDATIVGISLLLQTSEDGCFIVTKKRVFFFSFLSQTVKNSSQSRPTVNSKQPGQLLLVLVHATFMVRKKAREVRIMI